MPLRVNPATCNLDLVMNPGSGTATTEFLTDAGTANPTIAGVISIVGGTGISTSGAGSTVTITATGTGFTWNEITGTSAALVINNGYIANNAALITFTLPVTAAQGDTIQIVGKGAGLYTIAQNAGQVINFNASSTSSGIPGSLTSIEQFASLELVCTTTNTRWTALDSVGNFTVV